MDYSKRCSLCADSNTAALDGGAVALLRSSNGLATRNIFTNNIAGTFGGSVSLQPCVPPSTTSLNVFVGSSQANSGGTTGCGLSEVWALDLGRPLCFLCICFVEGWTCLVFTEYIYAHTLQ